MVENDVLSPDNFSNPQYTTDLVLDGTPTSFIKAPELPVPELSLLEDFSGNASDFSVTEGANVNIINETCAIGGSKILEVDGTALNAWAKPFVTIPLDTAVNSAKGLLVYLKWGENTNCWITVEGTKNSAPVSGMFALNDSNVPLYNTSTDEWQASTKSENPGAVAVPAMFEGYVYVPFSRIGFDAERLTALKIGGFTTYTVKKYSVCGVYLVKNDLIPATYTAGISNEVVLDGNPTSLTYIKQIALSSIVDFSDISNITAYNDSNDAETTVFRTIPNHGAVGGNEALEMDATGNARWQYTYDLYL